MDQDTRSNPPSNVPLRGSRFRSTEARLIHIRLSEMGWKVKDLANAIGHSPKICTNVIGGSNTGSGVRKKIEEVLQILIWSRLNAAADLFSQDHPIMKTKKSSEEYDITKIGQLLKALRKFEAELDKLESERKDLRENVATVPNASLLSDAELEERVLEHDKMRRRIEVIGIRIPDVERQFNETAEQVDAEFEALRVECVRVLKEDAVGILKKISELISPVLDEGYAGHSKQNWFIQNCFDFARSDSWKDWEYVSDRFGKSVDRCVEIISRYRETGTVLPPELRIPEAISA